MPPRDPIAEYLARLSRELRFDPALARRAMFEVEQHLREAARREEESGKGPAEAAEIAVARFGPAGEIARRMGRTPPLLRALVQLSGLGCVGIGAWLVYVIALVLPRHNPEQIPFWAFVAAGFLGLGSTAWLGLRHPAFGPLRWALGLAAAAGIGLGALAVVSQEQRAANGGQFEGYVALMGVCLALHGAVLLAHLFATRPRRFERA